MVWRVKPPSNHPDDLSKPTKGDQVQPLRQPAKRPVSSLNFPELDRVLCGCDAALYSERPWKNVQHKPLFLKVLRRRILHLAKHSGVGYAFRVLKDLFSEIRLAWLEDRPLEGPATKMLAKGKRLSRDQLAALALCKRALPPPSDREVVKALSAHKEALLEEYKTPEHLLVSARKFARGWARRYLSDEPVSALSLGSSSCLEYSRQEGGFTRWVSEKVLEMTGADILKVPKPHDVPLVAWAQEAAGFETLVAVEEYLQTVGVQPPKAEVVVLKEHGLKCRIITKSPAPLVYGGHVVRRKLFRGLRKSPEISLLLEGKVNENFQRYVGARGKLVSSDLKAASDLLPLDLVGAVVEGLGDSGRLSCFELDVLRKCTGPQQVTWPEPPKPSKTKLRKCPERAGLASKMRYEAETKRGILMGLPTTWSLLNLIHLFWWSQTKKETVGLVKEAGVFSCFGDDALMVSERPAIDAYHRIIRESGGVLSEGKHAVSRMRGVFLERLITCSGTREISLPLGKGAPIYRKRIDRHGRFLDSQKVRRKRAVYPVNSSAYLRISKVEVDKAVPVKGLLYPSSLESVPSKQVSGGFPVTMPLWVSVGSVVSSLAKDHCPIRLYRLQEYLHRPLRQEVQRLKLPCIPRELGGSGLLPSEKGWEEKVEKVCSRRVRKAIASLVTKSPLDTDLSAYSRIWDMAEKLVPWWIFEEGRQVIKCGYTPFQGELPAGYFDCGKDIVHSASMFVLEQAQLMGIATPEKAGRSEVAQRVHRVRDNLASLWRSAEPVKGPISRWIERLRSVKEKTVWGHPGKVLYSSKSFRMVPDPSDPGTERKEVTGFKAIEIPELCCTCQ